MFLVFYVFCGDVSIRRLSFTYYCSWRSVFIIFQWFITKSRLRCPVICIPIQQFTHIKLSCKVFPWIANQKFSNFRQNRKLVKLMWNANLYFGFAINFRFTPLNEQQSPSSVRMLTKMSTHLNWCPPYVHESNIFSHDNDTLLSVFVSKGKTMKINEEWWIGAKIGKWEA